MIRSLAICGKRKFGRGAAPGTKCRGSRSESVDEMLKVVQELVDQ